MLTTPTAIDVAFALLFTIVVSVTEYFVFWPRLKRRLEAGVPGARLGAYRRITIGEWAFAIATIIIWFAHGRPWSALGLVPAGGWHAAASVGVILAAIGLGGTQSFLIGRATPEEREAVRPRLRPYFFLLPRTVHEVRAFTVLSVTAGICEELLYRGYLVWFLRPWLGLYGAAAGSVIVFGLGHSYQGTSGAIRATLAGAALGAIVLLTGWLIPAMLLHASIDAASGYVGYTVLQENA